MNSTDTIGYMSLSEAADSCRYSQEYLSLRARQGKLQAVKVGRNWVTTRAWLAEYLRLMEEAQVELKQSVLTHTEITRISPPSLPRTTLKDHLPIASTVIEKREIVAEPYVPQAQSAWQEVTTEAPTPPAVVTPITENIETPVDPVFVNQEPVDLAVLFPSLKKNQTKEQLVKAGLSHLMMHDWQKQPEEEINPEEISVVIHRSDIHPVTIVPGLTGEVIQKEEFWPQAAESKQNLISRVLATVDAIPQPTLASVLVGVLVISFMVLNRPLKIGTNIAAGFESLLSVRTSELAANFGSNQVVTSWDYNQPDNQKTTLYPNSSANSQVAGAQTRRYGAIQTFAAGVLALSSLTELGSELHPVSQWLVDSFELPRP